MYVHCVRRNSEGVAGINRSLLYALLSPAGNLVAGTANIFDAFGDAASALVEGTNGRVTVPTVVERKHTKKEDSCSPVHYRVLVEDLSLSLLNDISELGQET